VGRSAVEVEVIFLYIFAMITLAVGQTEGAFLEDWIPAIPESNGETELLLIIGDPS